MQLLFSSIYFQEILNLYPIYCQQLPTIICLKLILLLAKIQAEAKKKSQQAQEDPDGVLGREKHSGVESH